jgi:N-acetylglutamate synthase-like GNAT family acetyltransferase
MKIEYLADDIALIPIIAHWHHEEWGHFNPGDSVERRITNLQTHLVKKQIPTTFVSLSRGILLGSASLVAHDMDTRMDLSPWLANVYVTPEHRGQGIGTALIQRVIDEAVELSIETMYLFTPNREGFFAGLGWSVVERTEYREQKVVIMALHIMDINIAA